MGRPACSCHLSRRRQGPCSRWMPRAHARHCTLSERLSRPLFEGTPLSNLFEGADGSLYGTTFNELDSSLPPGTDFQNQPCGSFHDGDSRPTACERESFKRVTGGCTERRHAAIRAADAAYSRGRLQSRSEWHGSLCSISSTASIARTLSQSSSRSTTAACTAQPRAGCDR